MTKLQNSVNEYGGIEEIRRQELTNQESIKEVNRTT